MNDSDLWYYTYEYNEIAMLGRKTNVKYTDNIWWISPKSMILRVVFWLEWVLRTETWKLFVSENNVAFCRNRFNKNSKNSKSHKIQINVHIVHYYYCIVHIRSCLWHYITIAFTTGEKEQKKKEKINVKLQIYNSNTRYVHSFWLSQNTACNQSSGNIFIPNQCTACYSKV